MVNVGAVTEIMKVSSPAGTRTDPVPPDGIRIFCEKLTVLALPRVISPEMVTNENVDELSETMLKSPAKLSCSPWFIQKGTAVTLFTGYVLLPAANISLIDSAVFEGVSTKIFQEKAHTPFFISQVFFSGTGSERCD